MKTLIIGKNNSINRAIGDLLKPDSYNQLNFILTQENLTQQDIENINTSSLIIIDLTISTNTKLFIRQIKQLNQGSIIIALHLYHEPEFIYPLIEAGASAYLLLNTNSKEIQRAIRSAQNGNVYITSDLQL